MADNWRLRAKCKNLSLVESEALFFPKSGRTKNEAIKYCTKGDCSVAEQCLEFALDNDCRGIWAGTTYSERRVMLSFRQELNSTPSTNPRSNLKKPKRTGFKIA